MTPSDAPGQARRVRSRAGWLILVSLVGSVLNLLWSVATPFEFANVEPRSWERFDASLVRDITSVGALRDAAVSRSGTSAPSEQLAVALWEVVADRFTHGTAVHTPTTRWTSWALGRLHTAFGHIYDPNALLRGGHSLNCDQAATVLMHGAAHLGFDVRKVALEGHVVVELAYDDGWHMFDPDLEVFVRDPETGDVVSAAQISVRPDLRGDHYQGPRAAGVSVWGQLGEESYRPFPGHIVWQDRVAALVESALGLADWLFPVLLLLWWVALENNHRRHRVVEG